MSNKHTRNTTRTLKRVAYLTLTLALLPKGGTLDLGNLLWWIIIPLFYVLFLEHDAKASIQLALEKNRCTNENMRHHRVASQVMKYVCPYDPMNCESYKRFMPLVKNTDCLYAKGATYWGSADWDPSLSLEENVSASLPMLYQFVLRQEKEHLHAFVFELRGAEQLCPDVSVFGQTVNRVLTTISQADPAGVHCMQSQSRVGANGWYFQFGREPLFVTTFAPCYDQSHSRYMFPQPSNRDSCFLLLQPETSFLHFDVPADSPHTNWAAPANMRERVRKNFRDHGRGYHIPPTVSYPPAHHIVKPLDGGAEVVEWWKQPRGCCPVLASRSAAMIAEATDRASVAAVGNDMSGSPHNAASTGSISQKQ